MNPFAAKQSGVASMIEAMLPEDVKNAIKVAQEKIPEVLEFGKEKIASIETRLIEIDAQQALIISMLENLRMIADPSATPRMYGSLERHLESLPTASPAPTGDSPSFEVDNG